MAELRGELMLNEPMGRHCSWRTGGPVRQLYKPADSADLQAFLQQLPEDEPVLWIGLGSNLLVRDGGYAGTAILTMGALQRMEILDGDILCAEAGVTCAKLARTTAREGYTGLEFFAGIPGTIGGALAMNAGAFGGETWEHVVRVETIDHRGRVRERFPEEFVVHYREVEIPQGEWFLAGYFRLGRGDVGAAQQRIRELLERRSATQPTTQPSCGSTFRNPANDHAARLIESIGLKGHCIGGACVSVKHANFIINEKDATASDIEQLIDYVQQQVAERCGVELVREVHIVGEAA
jgi:UDP-N-acetylmuramate dehydrogenase